jgi:hypothetical protein
MTMSSEHTPDEELLTEVDFMHRLLPPRERPYETGATLLAALGMVLGVSALFSTPMKPGFAGIGLAIIALTISGDRNRIPRIALLVAASGCFIGALLAVLRNTAFL